MRKILGTSKVNIGNKITILDAVNEQLHVKVGDLVVYYLEDDKIIISNAVISE